LSAALTLNKKQNQKSIRMKKAIIFMAVMGVFTACSESETATVNANDTTETFLVHGNCGMCEKTIEGAMDDVTGVSTADWNKDTDQITVSFDPAVITLDNIKQKIADVGYDSESHRSTETTYDGLPACCKYDRPE